MLRNCYINEGGEIEKRKQFVRHGALTAYGQTANYKGRITGPHPAEAQGGTACFFRHRHNSLPGSPWVAGPGAEAARIDIGTVAISRIWAMKSALPLTGFGALLRAGAVASFKDETHLIESFEPPSPVTTDHQHIVVDHAADGEPLGDSVISANDNRRALILVKDKAYVGGMGTVKVSAVGDASDYAGTGSAIFDVRSQSKAIGAILGFGDYFGQLAIAGQRGVQFWQVDPDPAKNQYLSTIPITLVSGQSMIGYGDGDIAYLAQDGVRSLRARDSSNVAGVSDFGSPIDRMLQNILAAWNSDAEITNGVLSHSVNYYHLARAVLHPETGQLWVCLKDKVYVFSHHADAKIRAWSTFDLPTPDPANENTASGFLKGQWVADICQFGNDIMFRNFADEVYIYGGLDGQARSALDVVEVVTPHMDMGFPGTEKHFDGIDIACIGAWKIEVSLDATLDPLVWEEIATVSNSTHRLTGKIPMDLRGNHIAVRLTSTDGNNLKPAKLGQIVIYHDREAEK